MDTADAAMATGNEHALLVALLGFGLAFIFGLVGKGTNFCTMGGVSDWINMGDFNRLRAWFLAIGTAIIGTQTMQFLGLINTTQSIYLNPNLSLAGYILGGFMFGIGMTLAGGCGQRILVRVGGGNLKSLVVMIVIGLTGYMTIKGIFAYIRTHALDMASYNLSANSISGQGIHQIVGADSMTAMIIGAAIGLILIVYAFISHEFRSSFRDIIAGLMIGLLVSAGWYVTGHLGFDDFEPLPVESFTFVGPTANMLYYLMIYTGGEINFGS